MLEEGGEGGEVVDPAVAGLVSYPVNRPPSWGRAIFFALPPQESVNRLGGKETSQQTF